MYIDANGKKWFKGNLHTHTTRSDGRMTPEGVCQLYLENGYDFLAITDHWKFAPSGEYQGMLLISGCEYDVGTLHGIDVYHILSLGAKQEPELARGVSPQTVIDQIHAAGGIACLAHPAWSLNSTAQIGALENLDCSEIFNSVSDFPHNARPYSGLLFDIMAAQGQVLNTIATDDVHFYEPCDKCRSFIYVQADECTEEAIIEAIKAGRCYSSQGPQMSLTMEDGKLLVSCSPVDEIVYYSNTLHNPDRVKRGENLTSGEYIPTNIDTYVRIELRKGDLYAWSQYIRL